MRNFSTMGKWFLIGFGIVVVLVAFLRSSDVSTPDSESTASRSTSANAGGPPITAPLSVRAASRTERAPGAPETAEVRHGMVIDRGGGGPLDWGYEHRQRFLGTLDRFHDEIGLTEAQHRALLVAVYDYQEQMFALKDDASRIQEMLSDEHERRYGTLDRHDGESLESWQRRDNDLHRSTMREVLKQDVLWDEITNELEGRLREILGREKLRDWADRCGPRGIECIEGIERSKYDLISIPGRAHLHTCEEFDPCYDQRQRGIGR